MIEEGSRYHRALEVMYWIRKLDWEGKRNSKWATSREIYELSPSYWRNLDDAYAAVSGIVREKDGLVERRPRERGNGHEYRITRKGGQVRGSLLPLREFGYDVPPEELRKEYG